MITYNKDIFIENYISYWGKINKRQNDGIRFLLDKLSQSTRIDTNPKRAYVLATIKWETAHTFQPITEYGTQAYLKSKPYYPYIGRGYVQLTWESNYKKFGKHLGIDLVKNPELANDPEIAWKILEIGMTDNFGIQDPNFTKYTLENFFNDKKSDYYGARAIINPKDHKSYQPIQEIAKKMLLCLVKSQITQKVT